jgi:hypothetical protein
MGSQLSGIQGTRVLLRGLLCVCVPLAAALAGAQAPGKPVPGELVSDGWLTVVDLNFSVTAPPGWAWHQLDRRDFEGKRLETFLAMAPNHESNLMVIAWEMSGRWSREESRVFWRTLAEATGKALPLVVSQAVRSDIPVEGSVKLSVKLAVEDGELWQFVYCVPGRRTYFLVGGGSDATEPVLMSEFVRSFRLLDAAANGSPPSPVHRLVLLLAVVGAVVDWRYKRKGGRRPTRLERLALAAAVYLVCLAMVFLGLRGASASRLGRMSGEWAIQIWGLWELSRFIVRRKHPLGRIVASV